MQLFPPGSQSHPSRAENVPAIYFLSGGGSDDDDEEEEEEEEKSQTLLQFKARAAIVDFRAIFSFIDNW